MNTTPSATTSSAVRLLHGVGVAAALLGAFVVGIMLLGAGIYSDRPSSLLIAIGALFSLGALIQCVRIVARWERRGAAELAAAESADQLVCERCGAFPREQGIACPTSRKRATVYIAAGAVLALVLLDGLRSGFDQDSFRVAFGVLLLAGAAGRWAQTPRIACPTCGGSSVVSRNSRQGVRWAARFEGQRAGG